MGIFGFNKRDDFLDLTKKFKEQQEKINNLKQEIESERTQTSAPEAPTGMFGFFGNTTPTSNETTESQSEGEDPREKRKKLAKRLMDMTDKIEDLSNQMFHLQQRVEILEQRNKPQY